MRFYVLGPLEVETGTGPVPIRGRRLRALFAVLLLHVNQIVPIDRIIDGLWPGEPPRSAVENIRTYISQSRALLSGADDPARLQSHPGGYRLVAEQEEVDLLRFTTLAAEGGRALRLGRCPSAAVLLGEALDLWRGAPLPELELGAAVRAKTLALAEQRWRVQADWISARLALGEHADLVPTLRELVGERPLDEGLWCRLVTALYATGRTAEALAAFSDARRTLVEELGIEPGPDLRRVQASVLAGEELAGAPPCAPGGPRDGAAEQSPPSQEGFVGRTAELRRLRRLLEEAGAGHGRRAVLVLVSGPPGVGKSATALALATASRAAYPDGQFHADLRGSSATPVDAAAALGALLAGFGVEPGALPQGLDRRRSLYRALLAGRRMLVVLDDAADASQLIPLIPGPGRALVIVTSRRRLDGIPVDLHLELPPLGGDEALEMLANLVGHQRLRREHGAGSAIVEACGRLPAAIRIAGARLAARPEHPLRLLAERLESGARVLDELSLNGHSLRQAFDASYQALEPDVQASFRRLGLLPPGQVTAADLAGLLGLPHAAAEQELGRLVDEGLLSCAPTGNGVARYDLPTVLHAYARERLAADGRSTAGMPSP
jgi:DNA-binding SARP family transcriptional activator